MVYWYLLVTLLNAQRFRHFENNIAWQKPIEYQAIGLLIFDKLPINSLRPSESRQEGLTGNRLTKPAYCPLKLSGCKNHNKKRLASKLNPWTGIMPGIDSGSGCYDRLLPKLPIKSPHHQPQQFER
jgi:hypothetical protein